MKTFKLILVLILVTFSLVPCYNANLSETENLYETEIDKGEVVPPGDKG